MGRYSNKKKNLRDEIQSRLVAMQKAGHGRSRHADKAEGKDRDKIYSIKTYQTYKQQLFHFKDWIKERYPSCRTLEAALPHANEWLQESIDRGLSAWTIATRRSALVKIYQTDDFIAPPSRQREHITRSRFKAKRDERISAETEARFSMFTSALGLRKTEMLNITGKDLVLKDGKPYVHVTVGTKGGKPRYAPVVARSKEELQAIIKAFRDAGENRVFPTLPDAYDNHFYRAEYAKRIYARVARPLEEIPKEDRRICRGRNKGIVHDRKALQIVSLALGHGRVDQSIASYLY